MPGAPGRVGLPRPQPAPSAAGRGGAQRSRLDPIRLNSATQRRCSACLGVLFPVCAVRGARRPGSAADRIVSGSTKCRRSCWRLLDGQGVEDAPGVSLVGRLGSGALMRDSAG